MMGRPAPDGHILSRGSHSAITIDLDESDIAKPFGVLGMWCRSTPDGEREEWERDVENVISLDEPELRELAKVLIARFPDMVPVRPAMVATRGTDDPEPSKVPGHWIVRCAECGGARRRYEMSLVSGVWFCRSCGPTPADVLLGRDGAIDWRKLIATEGPRVRVEGEPTPTNSTPVDFVPIVARPDTVGVRRPRCASCGAETTFANAFHAPDGVSILCAGCGKRLAGSVPESAPRERSTGPACTKCDGEGMVTIFGGDVVECDCCCGSGVAV